jgi:membrane associated rhomboid family serine protease/tetratricopeptide (TPR) repeat protein
MLPLGTDDERRGVPWATIGLILVNVACFIDDASHLGFILRNFEHAHLWHLLGNMFYLWVFGSTLEGMIGWRRFLAAYAISVLGNSIVWEIAEGGDVVGASGAIFGIMGLFAIRCAYSRMKVVVAPFLLPFVIRVGARHVLAFVLIKDIYGAIIANDNIAHWAHIGGFVTGGVLGWLWGYRSRALASGALAAAGRDPLGCEEETVRMLREAVRAAGDDPEVHLAWARVLAHRGEQEETVQRHYLRAASLFRLRDGGEVDGARAFLEHLARGGRPQSVGHHLAHARALGIAGDPDGASRILARHLDVATPTGRLGECLLAELAVQAAAAGRKDLAEGAGRDLARLFPGSPLPANAGNRARPIPGRRPSAPPATGILSPATRAWARWLLLDPVFVLFAGIISLLAWQDAPLPSAVAFGVLSALLVIAPFRLLLGVLQGRGAMREPYFVMLWLVFFAILRLELGGVAAALAAWPAAILIGLAFSGLDFLVQGLNVYRCHHVRTQAEADREFAVNQGLRKGLEAEREGRDEQAADWLREVLAADPANVEARRRLAIVYRRLGRNGEAASEFRSLFRLLPAGHPLKREAWFAFTRP